MKLSDSHKKIIAEVGVRSLVNVGRLLMVAGLCWWIKIVWNDSIVPKWPLAPVLDCYFFVTVVVIVKLFIICLNILENV